MIPVCSIGMVSVKPHPAVVDRVFVFRFWRLVPAWNALGLTALLGTTMPCRVSCGDAWV
jgi:hypothetical protein